jgi:prephenate dehydrogenase
MKIAIMGTGHMGRWFVQMLREEHELAIYDTDSAKMENIKGVTKLGNISDLQSFGPALLLNAVTLKNTTAAFKAALPYLSDACLVADVASIKSLLADYYIQIHFRFVSIHPMFGPTFANMKSLEQENVVIITESDPQGAGFFRGFFDRLGVRVYQYSFTEHDRMMAYSLTTPFISSLIFASCLEQKAVPGTTFKKHLAIAKSLLAEDDHLLTEILFNVHSLPAVENIAGRLEFFKHLIMQKDYEEMGGFIDKLRMNLVDVKS